MRDISWEEPYCGEGNNCFRVGTDDQGNAYIAVSRRRGHLHTDTREALRTLIREIKEGKADHLL